MIEAKATGKPPKLFVLDTNVILHDARCIENFQENDVAVPITVIEELDQFKKGSGDLNYQARQFLRAMDELQGDLLSKNGAPLGEGLGCLRIVLQTDVDPLLQKAFLEDCPDHRILNAALKLKRGEARRNVVLVTKDTNLRLKAKSVGVPAEDYSSDKVDRPERLYSGRRLVEGIPTEAISRLYEGNDGVPPDQFPGLENPRPNENFILRNGQSSALARFDPSSQRLERIEKRPVAGINPRNSEQTFALAALLDRSINLVTIEGKAGTGKTLLALAAAIDCRRNYHQILLARPIVPLGNRDIGFLPGDVAAKIDPYMQPLYDNLAVIRHGFSEQSSERKQIDALRETGKMEIAPLAYIRGRSLQRTYFIVDEAQNLTPLEVKTIVTRAGEGTKIVFTGDVHQIDHPYLDPRSNGLSYLISRFTGQPIYAHMSLEKGERSELADLASRLL